MKTLTQVIMLIWSMAFPVWAGPYEEAVRLITEKKYKVAQTLLTAEQKKADSVKIRYALGYCAERQGNKDEALVQYRQAVILNTNEGNRVSKEAELALKRLYVLRPEIFPVLQKAWDLETAAWRKPEGADRAFLMGGARMLYNYALDSKAPILSGSMVGIQNRICGKSWYMSNKVYYQFKLDGTLLWSTDNKTWGYIGRWRVEDDAVCWDQSGYKHVVVFYANYTKFHMIREPDMRGFTGELVKK